MLYGRIIIFSSAEQNLLCFFFNVAMGVGQEARPIKVKKQILLNDLKLAWLSGKR